MKFSERLQEYADSKYPYDWRVRYDEWAKKAAQLEARLASARAIMQKFVDKVERGMAKSIETYAEMKEWLDD